jgi:hypothetical protein
MHVRRAILNDLQTKLKTLSDYAGVWNTRIGPKRNAYPCITFFVDNEQNEIETLQLPPRPQDRKLNLSIKVWVKGTTDLEKVEIDMDAAAVSVEGVLSCPALATDIKLIETMMEVDENEPEIHSITFLYQIDYLTTEFAPV